MDEVVTEEQRAVLDAASQFAAKICPIAMLRERIHASPDFRDTYWNQAGELGWFSPLVPESLGGGSASDNGVLDAALIANVIGRTMQPGPFVGSNITAYAVAVAGTDEQRELLLPGVTSGEVRAVWAVNCKGGAGAPDAGVWATPVDGGYELRGFKSLVQDATWADWILVTAASPDGTRQFVIPAVTPGIAIHPKKSLDITRDFAGIEFSGVRVRESQALSATGDNADLVNRQLAIAAVLTAAQTVGTLSEDLARTVQYAKDRIAFGRPIGSFQAIKHLLVDASLSLELGKAVVLAAANALGTGEARALEAASMAKALVGESGVSIVSDCTQVFGGIGLTWEHDQHLFVRRVTTDASLYGDAVWHRERLCQLAGI
ncbi:MAG: acyl-CoA dehydrogenase family protein [Mycobacterium sp.]|nr:acyl-CoA dehydrogenase family protein [Mycobacterium sp.]